MAWAILKLQPYSYILIVKKKINKNLGGAEMRTCKKCGNENLAYPAHCHSTDVNDEGFFTYTCCVCLGHGFGASGWCVRLEAEVERYRAHLYPGMDLIAGDFHPLSF